MKIPEAIRQDKNIKWILLIGLLQTAACAVTYWFRISNPNIILIVILSAALVQFGYKAGKGVSLLRNAGGTEGSTPFNSATKEK